MGRSMDRLYAPWRSLYVEKKDNKQSDACPFCEASASAVERDFLILSRSLQVVVLLNRYPYNTGHLLIIPVAHVADLDQLLPSVRAEMVEAASEWSVRLRATFNCQGFNIGFNLGTVSGGSIPGHIHLHVLPRWSGDTNFLATLGDVKLVSHDLESVYDRLLSK